MKAEAMDQGKSNTDQVSAVEAVKATLFHVPSVGRQTGL